MIALIQTIGFLTALCLVACVLAAAADWAEKRFPDNEREQHPWRY